MPFYFFLQILLRPLIGKLVLHFSSYIDLLKRLSEIDSCCSSSQLANDVNGNGVADLGDEIAIKNEHFYVLKNENGSIDALAKYNLLIGNQVTKDGYITSPLLSPTGLQDPIARGYDTINDMFYGTVAFSNTSVNYEGSLAEAYVTDYVDVINTMNPTLNATGRLITKEEIDNLVNGGDELPNFDDAISMFIDGLKVFVVKFVYIIVPIILQPITFNNTINP